MGNFEKGVLLGFLGGVLVTFLAVCLQLDSGRSDCEKDLPRTQECTLQWVKPEVSK